MRLRTRKYICRRSRWPLRCLVRELTYIFVALNIYCVIVCWFKYNQSKSSLRYEVTFPISNIFAVSHSHSSNCAYELFAVPFKNNILVYRYRVVIFKRIHFLVLLGSTLIYYYHRLSSIRVYQVTIKSIGLSRTSLILQAVSNTRV